MKICLQNPEFSWNPLPDRGKDLYYTASEESPRARRVMIGRRNTYCTQKRTIIGVKGKYLLKYFLQHLREVLLNANLLAFARLAFVLIDHLLVPAPLPAQRRITRRASHRNRNQVRHTDHAIAVHFAILGHALRHLSVCLQVGHETLKFGEGVCDVCGFTRLERKLRVVYVLYHLGMHTYHLGMQLKPARLYTRVVESWTKASPMSWLGGFDIILYRWHVYINLSGLNIIGFAWNVECLECPNIVLHEHRFHFRRAQLTVPSKCTRALYLCVIPVQRTVFLSL